jgi:glycosyltransferase involved in cell wall biosynthesis
MTDVSVVVPTRNRSELLAMTLCSVLRQRDVDIEVLVVDEASTDDTRAMLAALADPRVRTLHHEVPQGVSTARNHGAAEARAEWVAFTDDDDVWAPDKLARQLRAADAAGRGWAYAGSVNIAGGLRVVHGVPPLPPEQVAAALPRYNAVPGGGSNVVVRREILRQVGPFDVRLLNTEDWEMWIRLAKTGLPAWVRSPLVARRVHPANSSLDIAEVVRGTRLIEQLHGTTADWGRMHRWFAESYLRTGQRRAALGQLALAAVHGQAGNVARDLAAIARRRLTRRSPAARPAEASDPGWTAEAAGWLDELERVG